MRDNDQILLEEAYETVCDEGLKSKLAMGALMGGLAVGGLDKAYSPNLPSVENKAQAEQVVQQSINKEKEFIKNKLDSGNFLQRVLNVGDTLKSFNKMKRNLKAIEKYAINNNVNIQSTRDIQNKIDRLSELSSQIRQNKLENIVQKAKSLITRDQSDSTFNKLSKALGEMGEMGVEISYFRLLMSIYEDLTLI